MRPKLPGSPGPPEQDAQPFLAGRGLPLVFSLPPAILAIAGHQRRAFHLHQRILSSPREVSYLSPGIPPVSVDGHFSVVSFLTRLVSRERATSCRIVEAERGLVVLWCLWAEL